MKIHYFQHVSFEGLGSIEQWLLNRNHQISCTKFFENDPLPNSQEIDALIIMGGPMSVNDESKIPWLNIEKAFIKDFIQTGKPILGICLGGQLIASALDAKVTKNSSKEIGWFPIESTHSSTEYFQLPSTLNVFHWHGETFSLPQNAKRLAQSSICENQAFQLNTNIIGLQFHLETTKESATQIIENCKDELIEDNAFVQSADYLQQVPQSYYDNINAVMANLLEYLIGSTNEQE